MNFLRRFDAKLIPLQQIAGKKGAWITTGEDPQFAAKWQWPWSIPPGSYKVTARGGQNLQKLTRAALYVDTGQGFSEGERFSLLFTKTPTNDWISWLRLERPVRALRFDPSDGDDRPAFALDALLLAPAEAPSPARAGLPDLRPKVLLNLVRLLPGEHGAGGAGRVCLGLVRTMPEFFRLRVALPPHHAGIASMYPDAEFVVLAGDDAACMAEHLEWCDCYVDPLNALRPKTIPPDVAVVAILHDLQHMRLPHFFSEGERRARSAEYGYAAERATRLVAVSNYERDNLHHFYGRDEISIVYNYGFMAEDSGFDERQIRDLRARNVQEPGYLIYPAVPWAHKNHEVLVQAIAVLQQRGIEMKLVMTNTRGSAGYGERISTLVSMFRLDHLIDRKAFLPEQELLDLMLNATGMVFPSLYEGFGIPLTDAMELGVPVLAASAAAIPEICGDAAAYLSNPRNALAVADDLARFWNDADRRATLMEAGLQRSKEFSARHSGQALAEAIRHAIANKKGLADPEQVTRKLPAPFAPISVLVLYSGLHAADLESLRRVESITAFHSAIFGPNVRVTVGLDLAIALDAELESIFRGAERLICFNDRAPGAIEFAVQDFAIRYDDAEYHIVVRYPDCARRYNPACLRSLRMALDLHPDADYATIESGLTDCALSDRPAEVAGVLDFEKRRRQGPVIFDALIRRSISAGGPHGTFAFLGKIETQARHLRVPETFRS